MSIRILRTASGCMASIGLIRKLMERGVEVICADADPLSVGLYYCKKGYVIPRGDDPNFAPTIFKISKKEHVNGIISGPEEEILSLSRHKELFIKENILPLVPDYESVLICSDKFKTFNFFRNLGILTPNTFFVENGRINETLLKTIDFPVVLKPRFGRGSEGIYIAWDKNELRFYLSKVSKSDYLIQELIHGVECTIDIFSDLNGEPLSIVPRKRLAVESGIAVTSQTFYNKGIIEYAYKIAKKLNLIGPANIQCIIDKSDNIPKFIEINPRFGGGSILSIKADPTIVENLIRIIKREKSIRSRRFKEGLIMLRYYSEVFISEEEIKRSGVVS